MMRLQRRCAAYAGLLGLLALAGCAASKPMTVSAPVTLPVPARPTLTPVPSSALMCLSDSAYTTIVTRERALRTWALELRAVIEVNNRAAKAREQARSYPEKKSGG